VPYRHSAMRKKAYIKLQCHVVILDYVHVKQENQTSATRAQLGLQDKWKAKDKGQLKKQTTKREVKEPKTLCVKMKAL
jgi:hypothetical protein